MGVFLSRHILSFTKRLVHTTAEITAVLSRSRAAVLLPSSCSIAFHVVFNNPDKSRGELVRGELQCSLAPNFIKACFAIDMAIADRPVLSEFLIEHCSQSIVHRRPRITGSGEDKVARSPSVPWNQRNYLRDCSRMSWGLCFSL